MSTSSWQTYLASSDESCLSADWLCVHSGPIGACLINTVAWNDIYESREWSGSPPLNLSSLTSHPLLLIHISLLLHAPSVYSPLLSLTSILWNSLMTSFSSTLLTLSSPSYSNLLARSAPSTLSPSSPHFLSLTLSRHFIPWQEPYLQSVCECCSYRLDPDNPVRFLSLQCESGESEPVVLPVIHSCECTSCQGGEWWMWPSGFACASLMSVWEQTI